MIMLGGSPCIYSYLNFKLLLNSFKIYLFSKYNASEEM